MSTSGPGTPGMPPTPPTPISAGTTPATSQGAGLPDHARRALRTLIQLVAGGALTALVDAFAHGLAPTSAALILGAWTTVVAFTQNLLEDSTSFPAILKAPASSGINPEP